MRTVEKVHLSLPDSDWEGAHLVFVPYCSSDAHMGDSEHEVGIGIPSGTNQ